VENEFSQLDQEAKKKKLDEKIQEEEKGRLLKFIENQEANLKVESQLEK
jgi:hypothetical protein